MEYAIEDSIKNQIVKLSNNGGNQANAARKVNEIIGSIYWKSNDPFKGIPITNHGESRVKHVVKYDLPGYCRLITIVHNGITVLKYFGTHEECHEWLEKNKGQNLAIDSNNGLTDVFKSSGFKDGETINLPPHFNDGLLYLRLKKEWEILENTLPKFHLGIIKKYNSQVTDNEIIELAESLTDKKIGEMVLDVLLLLRAEKIDEARSRLALFQDEMILLEDATPYQIENIKSNDKYINIHDLEEDDLKILMNSKNWFEWMLFLHPTQREVVDADFSGSARLLGVSGSGKTCVIVKRAYRLAGKYPSEKILILTLNESLAKLIKKLIDLLCESKEREDLKSRIVVKSFWLLCKELIIDIEKNPLNEKILTPITKILVNSIDDIWHEFYTYQFNNDDAKVFLPIHQSLTQRGLFASDYIRQEFDWIRSVFPLNMRNKYLDVDREGRSIPFQNSDRMLLLDGLEKWELKMKDVGAIDYLGLANKLYKYLDILPKSYKCIMVDESQDFGTLELEIIRNLVNEGENDLFLAGDIAQRVYTKHHKITHAGIRIQPENYLKILKNYRNGREILEAAYSVFKSNVNNESIATEDYEVLDPQYANFSTTKPFIWKSENIHTELIQALNYLSQMINENLKEKACIAICGYSSFDLLILGKRYNLNTLDGHADLSEGTIFISDLEQTKGFEFDRIIIINCEEGIIPNTHLPNDEIYREISKLYVSMTRAKKELIISYHKNLSKIFNHSKQYFIYGQWRHEYSPISYLDQKIYIQEPELEKKQNPKGWKVTGQEFLFTYKAIGISKELQDKLITHVDGQAKFESTSGGKSKQYGWKNMDDLRNILMDPKRRDNPLMTRLFGRKVLEELQGLFLK